jgi:hypothetical protein
MNRKDTDLLELFRGPGGGAPRRSSRGSAARASSSSSSGAFSLDRRRAVLAAAAAVLVVVLAFVAGIGIGKAKSRGSADVLAARLAQGQSPTWSLTSQPIPQVGLSGENLPQKVYEELIRKWPEFTERVVATLPPSPVDKPAAESGHRCLTITGFPDRNSAQSVQFQLAVFTVVGAGCPFGGSAPQPER